MTDTLPAHSALGASGAERWMNCGGSVALLKRLDLPQSDEPDYRAEGTAAHEAAAKCLREGLDGWEIIGEKFGEVEAGENMATAIQVYIDVVRPGPADVIAYGIEDRFHRPELHEQYFGTVDYWRVVGDLLDVTDYKHGVGIAVDIEWNPQVMYYAYAKLQEFSDVRRVRLRIVQPRGFHPDGPVREWEISAEDLAHWAETELLPIMRSVETSHDLNAGPWCRFCPAKLVCPLMDSLFGAAAKADPKRIVALSLEALGLSYQSAQAVRFYLKALEDEVYHQLNTGADVPGTKLVAKKANRVYKAGAEEVLKARFGDLAYSKPELKSPAQVAEIGPEAVTLLKEWAYVPHTGVTVALASDKRAAVKVQSTSATFAAAVAKLENGTDA